MIFYLIFAIIGVTNWKGALNVCNDHERTCNPAAGQIPSSHPGLECTNCNATFNFPNGLRCADSADSAQPPNAANACTGNRIITMADVVNDPEICLLINSGPDQDRCRNLWYCKSDLLVPS